jgi:hypothetical protein
MAIYVGVLRLPPLVANALSVVTMSIVNFFVADRWVFTGGRSGRSVSLAAMLVLAAIPASAAPRSETILAWNRYVADAERRIEQAGRSAGQRGLARDIGAEGESSGVPSGTISRWRGSVFLPGARLDDVVHRLQYPGTPPPQEDVVSSRVIARGTDSLRVGIRLVRHAIVTVSYDTEHEMQFRRLTPRLATARSVATRIDQVDGGDHGFLWRLHSYWRYEETGGGVLVELRSLTLSRHVPALVRPIAGPLVNRVARESMVRTLEALRKYFGAPAGAPYVRGAAL